MARLDPLDRQDLPEHKGLFELVEHVMGFVPNSMLTMARKPEMLNAFAGLLGAITGPGTVDTGLKQLISEVASHAAGCQYCVAHTSHVAHRGGEAQEKLDEVWTFETSDKFSAAEKAALTVAMKAAQVPNLVEDADFVELKKHFDDMQIVEIVGVISMFGFLNRWNGTMATALEAPALDYARGNLPSDKWSLGDHLPDTEAS